MKSAEQRKSGWRLCCSSGYSIISRASALRQRDRRIVHGLISFVGTVLSVYIGCKLTEKEYPLIEDEEQDEPAADSAVSDAKQDR
ncbi:MAG: hypothetical protein ACLT4C_04570 [Butyricicoccus sp.]